MCNSFYQDYTLYWIVFWFNFIFTKQDSLINKYISHQSSLVWSGLFPPSGAGLIVGRLDLLLLAPAAGARGLGLLRETVQELNTERVVALLGGLVPLAAQLVEHLGLLGRDEIQDLTKVRGVFFQVERVLPQQQGNLKEGLG